MRVVVKEGEAVLLDLRFEDEELYIGSGEDCAVRLPDEQVLDRNAVIAPALRGGWQIQNMDPDHPLALNDKPLNAEASLTDGDQLTIHGYRIEFHPGEGLNEQVVEDTHLGAEELAKIRKFPLPAGSIVKRPFDGITMVKDQLDQANLLGVEISSCRDIHELVDITLRLLHKAFGARVAWIGLRRQARGDLEVIGGRLPSGQSCDTTPLINLLQYRCTERNQHICIRKVRDQKDIGSALAAPVSAGRKTYGMIYVDHAPRTKRFQTPDLDLLTAFGSAVGAKLDALQEGRFQREAAVSTTQASVIQAVQSRLDPKRSYSWPNLKMAAYSRSGQEAPGDVYDIMRRPDSGITAFLLGHARAEGADLVLSMARLHATFRVAMLHNDPAHAFARELNWLMFEQEDSTLVDAMCVLLDPASGKINYCRAGKIGAFLVDPKGEPRKLPPADGPSLGAARNYEYVSRTAELAPGETLAIYSGGITRAVDAEGQRYREMKFIETVCDGFGQPPAQTVQDISDEMTHFLENGRHPDDITVMLLHRTMD